MRLQQRYRYLRARGHAWMLRHPRVQAVLEASGCLRGGAEAVARGVFVGLFVGLTPTVGAQTLFMISGCIIVRGNFPAAFAVSWVSNPFTMAPLYWGFHAIGQVVFGSLPFFASGAWYLDGFIDEYLFAVLGSLLIALPAAMAGYAVSHRLSAVLRARRLARAKRQS
ncbi:MAG: DUF2062 domain-containing protein [Algiphilus sp.]